MEALGRGLFLMSGVPLYDENYSGSAADPDYKTNCGPHGMLTRIPKPPPQHEFLSPPPNRPNPVRLVYSGVTLHAQGCLAHK